MILKYFKHHYHFPLTYFLYIPITPIITFIIIHHHHPINTFLYSLLILILIIPYFIINITPPQTPHTTSFFKN
ncbi:phosphate-starvation-inducible PsiE family protein [Siminovitchia fortis]|uniref:phosphate-starvation-inducible PsiE family protein n=1 Tax=Siminovitchia fortis TaxID=254758 RepID=UPI0028CBA000|nr:phosphate-starvation-inducible PsiE family protein [Siminovitchia fortis]